MPSVIARIHSLDQGAGIREHRNKYGPGITPVYDQVTGQVLEIRFSELTESDAQHWLDSHGYVGFTLESDESHPDTHEGKRYLAVELSPSSDIQEVDGGLLVPGVKLLAPGTWTDSTQKTPCRYTTEILERYHANWTDLSYWSRHSGGTPRDITDRIADIRNIRFEDGITADLFFHGTTTKSKDSIALLKAAEAGKVPWPYSSVEMFTRDKWIVSEKIFEAQEILFDGAAMVNQGACRTCKIRNNEGEGKPEETPSNEHEHSQEDSMAEFDKDAFKAELVKELSAVIKPEPVKVEIPKELTELIATQDKTIKELSARLEKIEKAPADPKTSGSPEVKELGLPEYCIPVNRKTGIVGGSE